jgi:hypothetical protein
VKLTPNLTANSTADEHRRGPQHADLIPGINALFVITPEEVRRLQTTHQAIFFFRINWSKRHIPCCLLHMVFQSTKDECFLQYPKFKSYLPL